MLNLNHNDNAGKNNYADDYSITQMLLVNDLNNSFN